MFTRKEDMLVRVEEHLRGGEGKVTLRNFLSADNADGAGRLFAINTLEPGCSIGKHGHKDEYEVYYITKGTAEIVDDDDVYILHAGDMMKCNSGSEHGIKNVGDDELEFVALILFTRQ